MRALLAVLLLAVLASTAKAAVTAAQLAEVGAIPLPRARLDPALTAVDVDGQRHSLAGVLGGQPAFLLFADYTCRTLCGTELFQLGAALTQARLPPGSFHIVVMGIDPKDQAAAAIAMAKAEIPAELQSTTRLLLPDAKTIARATRDLGFRYIYDPSIDQFAHPAVIYVLRPDGSVQGVLSPFDLATVDLKAALSGSGGEGVVAAVRTLCNGLSLLTGIYDGPVLLATRIGSGAALLFLVGFVGFLIRRRRRLS